MKFRENVVDANQVEAPATSSSPVEVNDDEMTFEDLSVLSSPLASVSLFVKRMKNSRSSQLNFPGYIHNM